ncbi:ABC transporter permease [Ancylobacter amanitiformis]|uniref:ABC-2 type transport system permease protein n=1 Tax=Ancylobacter amanitiformis TaxID=217069 RepID=A0ABU0LKW0_9HYPH|nr:ABC transporter permease [Ancylobacter amanitiformis]MDQ0509294.1 ABC-2 type transport system permease protein [Ancylobacter amanitiformis]
MSGFLRRVGAMVRKEFLQLLRDRVSFATMIMIPLLQLVLFGYAINTTPRHLPTAVLAYENTPLTRSILAAIENTKYFAVTHHPTSAAEAEHLMRAGDVLFVVEIPAGFERAVVRGENPAMLVAADATDPVASGSAIAALRNIIDTSVRRERFAREKGPQGSGLEEAPPPFEIITHARYNPAAVTQLNIVPGLLGTILTMTMLIFTALSVTREIERGTMETLLAMPIRPVEVMLGKIAPYVMVGAVQATMIVVAGIFLFKVPVVGSMALLTALTALFIVTNLSIGYTFSTLAQNQLQAVQMTFMYFLPNILLSGFMFPFDGMPRWARWISETLPLTHYLRMVRGILLKGANVADLSQDILALSAIMLVAMVIAVKRFRQTLD